MKVLWFTNSPSCYTVKKDSYNGGGWISSLQKEIEKVPDIDLRIAFHLDSEPFKSKAENVTYYPIPNPTIKKYQKNLIWLLKGEKKLIEVLENKYLDSYLKVIDDFRPDIIHIFGVNNPSNNYKLTNIKADNNLIYRGIVDSNTLRGELKECAIYVHPSYIDNSPNSLCEAQMMGIPSIATYVGGIPTLIENGQTGFLVPANDPYQTAFIISTLLLDENLRNTIGKQAKEAALVRHDKAKITNQLLNIYGKIIS